MIVVKGRCPMGCGETLFLGEGGYVTCSYVHCTDPTAASDKLHTEKKHPLAAQCTCGHAKWAHAAGPCSASCPCRKFNDRDEEDQLQEANALVFNLDLDAAAPYVSAAREREREAEEWSDGSKNARRLMQEATNFRTRAISIALKMEPDES